MIGETKYVDSLKLSVIIPVFKNKGNQMDVNNYRPISILPQIHKVFEPIIYEQMIQFLESNKLLDSLQYGFRSGRGCPDAICKLLNVAGSLMDEGQSALILSIDVSKAFDSVDHGILIKKLCFLGFRGNSLRLLESFLCNREQMVLINNSKSDVKKVVRGVPQGSNLGRYCSL